MNPFSIGTAFKGARSAYGYLRKRGDQKQRQAYESLINAIKNNDTDNLADNSSIDELEDVYGAARREAGALTRQAHDRLDRRRAAFAAAAPSRKERRKALKQEAKAAKKKSKGKSGKIIGWILGVLAAVGAGWAVSQLVLKKDKTALASGDEKKTAGETTVVYSTETPRESSAGPLGEEPAERDEELLNSIDQQLTSLDTLDDDQRHGTR